MAKVSTQEGLRVSELGLSGSGWSAALQPADLEVHKGDFTWNSMSGRSVRLKSVPVQSLSELERARLQEVAFYQLQQDCDLGCQITIPKDGQKRKKSLRKKLDSLGKEKNRDKEFIPQAFGMPLSQVIANDRAYKLKQDSQREEQKDVSDFVAFLLPFGTKRQNKELSSSNSSLSSTSETPNESTSPNTPEPAPRARRRGAMSVDSITDLDDNHSRLLEALQLSLPAEAQSKKEKARDKKLSLNPIYRQVPRLVDSCCQHLEKHVLEPDEQLSTLQLLIYLLPPCNCDTLHRLLQFLSTVAGHAEDTRDKDGQEITGNKMTSLNLATIFGPNLLHKQKSTDKEFSVQSSARAEESTAIIAVVQKMIENYETLFMVSPDLQNEVLISLLETDPDVVDYLLRRKASQSSSPEMLRSEGSYSTGERHSSTDSNKASSGDVSPYDNNSPVLSERSLVAMQEEVARSPDKLYKLTIPALRPDHGVVGGVPGLVDLAETRSEQGTRKIRVDWWLSQVVGTGEEEGQDEGTGHSGENPPGVLCPALGPRHKKDVDQLDQAQTWAMKMRRTDMAGKDLSHLVQAIANLDSHMIPTPEKFIFIHLRVKVIAFFHLKLKRTPTKIINPFTCLCKDGFFTFHEEPGFVVQTGVRTLDSLLWVEETTVIMFCLGSAECQVWDSQHCLQERDQLDHELQAHAAHRLKQLW
ncbi:hypothetical protein DUI87_15911 [Hirundo rustica rustica]|uniref:Rho-GAP domain-containing protein n=1 Tax=Hirundo rustica rustica TaxID=333673 RepID=A0A3M0K001_HIRRU|nr:hypothetical protein DUI87_15911 [Hirundo rustica rustica]